MSKDRDPEENWGKYPKSGGFQQETARFVKQALKFVKKFEKFFTIPLPFGTRLEYNKTAQIHHNHNYIKE